MMPTIAFGLANYVARQLAYHMDQGWAQGERATSAYFQPLSSFPERLASYLNDVRALGFDAVDLWQPILDQSWVTDAHLRVAAEVIGEYGLRVVGFAGILGASRRAFERNCEICSALDIPLLVGMTPLGKQDRGFVVDTLKRYGLKWAYENESEQTPAEILTNAGDPADGTIGICADAGWFGTHGYDAADALRQLAPRLFHVHLKDVRERGCHDTCRFGEGVVDLARCVQVLQDIGYDGALVVEHEAELFDPTDDVRASLALLQSWLKT